MSAAPPPRTRGHATPTRTRTTSARPRSRRDRSDRPGGVLLAAAQILLGLTLSCLLAVLCVAALGAIIVVIIYLTK
ncbi:hypothetical protein KGA66_22910 [Actinocrinis puniceicyclus]|uniref:Uncharacterized protein n=1 Tax=Actinocrinis puniceicyclus TaxID=977794 RepID=A0A8J7WVG7_9ACTN|nr:hypothetical protein [Actinocrinis puniceicyclus]MBS2965914.1 hypothetical protein [Actinocrinis puniceicyclus]